MTEWPIPGGIKSGCPECQKYILIWDGPRPPDNTQTATPTARPTTGHVCRDHHDQQVTFKGKGCPRCPTRKANKRKASQPSDYTEMETHR